MTGLAYPTSSATSIKFTFWARRTSLTYATLPTHAGVTTAGFTLRTIQFAPRFHTKTKFALIAALKGIFYKNSLTDFLSRLSGIFGLHDLFGIFPTTPITFLTFRPQGRWRD